MPIYDIILIDTYLIKNRVEVHMKLINIFTGLLVITSAVNLSAYDNTKRYPYDPLVPEEYRQSHSVRNPQYVPVQAPHYSTSPIIEQE